MHFLIYSVTLGKRLPCFACQPTVDNSLTMSPVDVQQLKLIYINMYQRLDCLFQKFLATLISFDHEFAGQILLNPNKSPNSIDNCPSQSEAY